MERTLQNTVEQGESIAILHIRWGNVHNLETLCCKTLCYFAMCNNVSFE